ncbi:29439_t:CDS:2, partial [Racocetra persica]
LPTGQITWTKHPACMDVNIFIRNHDRQGNIISESWTLEEVVIKK